MTEEDLREIEDRLRDSGNKPVRLLIATLSLDVEKLLAEVRRLRAVDAAAEWDERFPRPPDTNAGGGNLDE